MALLVLAGGCVLVARSPAPPPPPAAYHHGLPPMAPSPPPVTAPLPPPTVTNWVPPTGTASFAPPSGSLELPPPPAGQPELLPAGAAEGRPPRFVTGAGVGYWIWQGPRGSWLLRTTTGGEVHTFSGHLLGTSTPVTEVSPTTNALGDHLRRTDGGFAFSFQTSAHADGFTFVVDGARCARLDLRIDAAPAVRRIFVGGAQLQPRSGHFILCPRGQTP